MNKFLSYLVTMTMGAVVFGAAVSAFSGLVYLWFCFSDMEWLTPDWEIYRGALFLFVVTGIVAGACAATSGIREEKEEAEREREKAIFEKSKK